MWMKMWDEVMIPTLKSVLLEGAMFDFELRVGIHPIAKRNFCAQLAALRPFSTFSDVPGLWVPFYGNVFRTA